LKRIYTLTKLGYPILPNWGSFDVLMEMALVHYWGTLTEPPESITTDIIDHTVVLKEDGKVIATYDIQEWEQTTYGGEGDESSLL
jgi:hypothetical protein